jgi:hypothetical protein
MNNGLLRNINFWVFSVGLKIVPCILLTYLSLALIRVLLEAEKRRQRLKSNVGVTASHISVASAEAAGGLHATVVTNTTAATRHQQLHDFQQVNQEEKEDRRNSNRSESSIILRDDDPRPGGSRIRNSDRLLQSNAQDAAQDKLTSSSAGPTPSCSVISSTHQPHVRGQKNSHHPHNPHHHHHPHVVASSSSQSDRTTKMLLAILLLYLVTEMPNGVITLLVGLLGESFQNNVYQPLGEIFDILALINSGINFILLASMSRLFRKTFCKIFWPRKYHAHFQRDNPQCTEKTNINHHTIAKSGAGAAFLNQSATMTAATATTTLTKSNSPFPSDRIIELNQLTSRNCDAVTAIITVTEPSQHEQLDQNNETTMV